LRQSWQSAGKELAAAEARVRECDRALRQLRGDKEKLLQRITADREAAGSLDQLLADQAAAEQRMGEIAGAVVALGTVAYDREAHAAARLRLAELENLQRRADQMEERVRRRPQVIAEIARVEGVLQEFKRMEADAQAEQARLGYDEQAYEAANSALRAATKVLLDANESHAKAREAAARSQTAEEALQAQKEQQQKKRQEIAAAQAEIVYLDALDVYLKKFRLDLAGRIRPLLARRASELIALTTRGRYIHLELDEEYLISLYDGNRLFPLGRFSGGEQDLANLCLRVAISQILAERSGGAPINFIVLDEILGSQDEERKAAILDALGQLSSQFRQIFMITHVD
jgi:exonuclease SbcC